MPALNIWGMVERDRSDDYIEDAQREARIARLIAAHNAQHPQRPSDPSLAENPFMRYGKPGWSPDEGKSK